MAKVYGIDLGTTYSVISTLDDNGMPEIVANQDEGSNTLASAVYFQEGGDPVVGEVAKNQKDIEPERVVEFVKRYIGSRIGCSEHGSLCIVNVLTVRIDLKGVIISREIKGMR